MITRRNWQREELLLALNLYCRLPFGKYHNRNPEIIKIASFMERSPSALAMKLSNFASFDPYHKSRGVVGLKNASRADIDIWEEFTSDWENLAIESEIAYTRLSGEEILSPVITSTESDIISREFSGPTETERKVKVRLGQQFFRKMILSGYTSKCCVCGMPIPELLIASHIVPWSHDASLRTNPHNGLCLCALHDKGFDLGLFTLDDSYKILIGQTIGRYLPHSTVNNAFKIYEGQMISLPDKFIPKQEFLSIHRAIHFLR